MCSAKALSAMCWLIGTSSLLAVSNTQTVPGYLNPKLDLQLRVDDLVARMTLQEKISQMVNDAPRIERLGIPKCDWWNECLHGVGRAGIATVFPQAIGMAASFDRELMYQVATAISDEARAKHHQYARQHNGDADRYYGLTFWTPNINIFRDPRWGRGQETYGEDPYLTGQMGIQFVKGLQGDHPRYLKVIATAKHYAVHSGPEPERHRFDAVVDDRDLFETYLPAFRDLVVDAHVSSVMGAYNRVNGVPACASQRLLDDILRGQWGFDGYVVSDCGAIDDIYKYHNYVPTPQQAAAIAVKAGCDLECGTTYNALLQAVQQGLISQDQIDTAVKRLFMARMRLGMFDPPEMVPYAQIPFSVNDCPKHDALARRMAQESIVLLTNTGILPLRKDLRSIAVIGPNAQDVRVLHGNYEGRASHPVTILAGITNHVGPYTQVLYSKGCPLVEQTNETNERSALFQEAVELTAKAEVAIFVGGLSPAVEGEEMYVPYPGFRGGDRTSLDLPACQQALIKAMYKTGTPVVLVLTSGGGIAVNWEDRHLPAIIQAWYPGQQGGNAVADVIFGDYNPAGRLPITFYRSLDQVGDFNDYRMTQKTYRYLKDKPLYPFGHGLSYSSFAYSGLRFNKTSVRPDEQLLVTFTVANTSSRDGQEVPQLYVRRVWPTLPGPIKQLRGFERISIKAGQAKTITIRLVPRKDMAHYDQNKGGFVVEPGQFEIQVGGSSQDIRLKGLIAVR